ncbi:MAG: sulfotransferase domain-containing protein [Anaerolineales bacterium]
MIAEQDRTGPDPEARYVVIGGATRCGTTSLFLYLADHPGVCRSKVKETRFFLEKNHPLSRQASYEQGLSKYMQYFDSCNALPVRLEATPDYLYSQVAAGEIRRALSNVLLIFLLREPIDRLVSWFHYGRQRGLLTPIVSFEQYVQASLEDKFEFDASDQLKSAMRQGRYSSYLGHYLSVFAAGDLAVYNYDQFADEPEVVVSDICRRVGLSSEIYDEYRFEIHNPSRPLGWLVSGGGSVWLLTRLRDLVRNRPRIRGALRHWKRNLDNLKETEGVVKPPHARLSPETFHRLEDYYRDEPQQLAALLQLNVWRWKTSSRIEIRNESDH